MGKRAAKRHLDWERREAKRWREAKPLRWRVRGGSSASEGVIVERSLYGMALLTEEGSAPETGAHLKPETNAMAVRHGFRCAVVTRRDTETTLGRRRVYLEILA